MRYAALFAAVAALCLTAAARADVKPASLFQDNLVLQQGIKVPVWGTAEAGEKVTVKFGSQTKEATAGKDGKWKVQLDALKAEADQKPAELTIAGKNTITIKNVLVGEVWICSGQSNMEFGLAGTRNSKEELAAANYPQIRMFNVTKNPTSRPVDSCGGKWDVCTPSTSGWYSAVGYFFARELHKELKVPVGMIHTSWGGTAAEPWTELETLRAMPEFKGRVEGFEKLVAEYVANQKDWDKRRDEAVKKANDLRQKWFDKQLADDEGSKGQWWSPSAKTEDWKDAKLPMDISKNEINAYLGFAWFRKDVTIPKEWVGKDLVLDLGPVDDVDITYVNGEKVGSMWFDNVKPSWMTPHEYTVPGKLVTGEKVTIVVRELNTFGAAGMLGVAKDYSLNVSGGEAAKAIPLAGTWKYRLGSTIDVGKIPQANVPVVPGTTPGEPSTLYNGMIAPLVPYAIRGAIWYQGESNAGAPEEYRKLFPAMIGSWRKAWGQGDFAFEFVQLANFMGVQETAIEANSWAGLRNAQLGTLATPNTGMACIIDIGDAGDIHPKNKQDVGYRLALWTLAKTYGKKDLVYSGPLYRSMKVEGDKAIVSFDSVGKGLVAKGQPLVGFAVAGEDKVFHVAKAEIKGETVVVSSDKVTKPVAVRYAWANNPVCNLYNASNLPASPFRTDAWAAADVKAAPDEKAATTEPAK